MLARSRWVPTPFVTISMGTSKQQLIFTTLSRLNNKKYFTNINITQTSQTTVEYTVSLSYYPYTFGKASYATNLETRLNLAMQDDNLKNLYLTFGYESNSPYTGSAESSPVYVGLITNLTSQVHENYITYNLTGYGVDLLASAALSIDKRIDKLIKPHMNVQSFIRKDVLKNGKFTINDKSCNFKIEFDNSVPNNTFIELLLGTAPTASQAVKNPTTVLSMATLNSMGNQSRYNPQLNVQQVVTETAAAINALRDKRWNDLIKSIDFDSLTNPYTDSVIVTNQGSADKEGTTDRNQFSVYETIEMLNRFLNINQQGIVYNLRCIVDPYSNNSGMYDGTIRIFNAGEKISSKRNFYYGIWNNSGKLSNNCTVVSWNCDYNATAKIFSGNKVNSKNAVENYSKLSNLAKNLNTDLELCLDDFGYLTGILTSSQTKDLQSSDYRLNVLQNTQYGYMLNAIQDVLDYPYEASITVLGITDTLKIGVDTINVYVFVNGTEHFTSGEYLITGYSHSISNSGTFHTTYKLLKVASSKGTAFNAVAKLKSIISEGKSASDAQTAYFSSLS